MRLASSVLLLILGLAFPLLLNGQVFSNGLMGIACSCIAVALGLSMERDMRLPAAQRSRGRVVGLLGILLMVLIAATLPGAYQQQRAFNRTRRELRQKWNQAALARSAPARVVPDGGGAR